MSLGRKCAVGVACVDMRQLPVDCRCSFVFGLRLMTGCPTCGPIFVSSAVYPRRPGMDGVAAGGDDVFFRPLRSSALHGSQAYQGTRRFVSFRELFHRLVAFRRYTVPSIGRCFVPSVCRDIVLSIGRCMVLSIDKTTDESFCR